MRLKLILTSPANAADKAVPRVLEQGELLLGRSADCDWQLIDPDRLVSKIHCRIMRDSTGFLVRDESMNGLEVDGLALAEGQTARLKDGSSIVFCGFSLTAEISGEAEPDWNDLPADIRISDELPSITSILADVAPAGSMSASPVQGRAGDEWFSARTQVPSRQEPSRHGNVEIGWSGPPTPEAGSLLLPPDWNDESEMGNAVEHTAALHTSIRLRSRSDGATASAMDSGPTSAPDWIDPMSLPPTHSDLSGRNAADPSSEQVLARIARRLADLEQDVADFYDGCGMGGPQEHYKAQFPPAGPPSVGELERRLSLLRLRQSAVQDAVRDALQEAAARLDPRAIEARVDAAATAIPLMRASRYWNAYRAECSGSEPLVTTIFNEALRRRSSTGRTRAAETATDTTDEA